MSLTDPCWALVLKAKKTAKQLRASRSSQDLTYHDMIKFFSCGSAAAFRYPCFNIQFEAGSNECTAFPRANAACQQSSQRTVRNQINGVTSFIDGSQIYSSQFTRNRLLRNLDGK